MYNKNNIDSIRILPMSMPLEFDGFSWQDVQKEYFMKSLIENNGEYYYRTSGMITNGVTLVLFQFSNRIIASAILEYACDVDNEIYKGKYVFDPKSIAVFKYISADEMKEIFNIKKLSQSKQCLDFSKINDLLNVFESKNITFVEDFDISFDEFFYDDDCNFHFEDKTEKVLSNQVNRYQQFRRRQIQKHVALKHANFQCEISASHESFVSKVTGKSYVEAHHLIQLAYQDEYENSLDVSSNIVSLCPNCHRLLHHAHIDDKRELLNSLLENRKKD